MSVFVAFVLKRNKKEKKRERNEKEKEVEKMNLAESIVKETPTEKAKTFEEVFARFDNNFS